MFLSKKCLGLCFSFCLLLSGAFAQSHTSDVLAFQEKLNKSYADPDKSPLSKEKLQEFEGLPFFPIDENYRVVATFQKLPKVDLHTFKTSDNRLRDYEKYGIATFTLDGQEMQLTLFKSISKVITPGYENSLFLPFTDLTNGKETYGGGRYMDVEIPEGDSIVLDFNKSYNPYCAYSTNYSCPIPPKENDLPVYIKAGIKHF
ncbi:DUF1684 domain-containing protein [Algoriphagus sp. NBT04N3]|uniref:DUF1684 domain-containing protein n=1 Tax=Algoriphagus sp. NBT04N3 TaxID=2705473 RepID=UPI001C636FE8|nr:DUF1684 domain-containing protein [Algoriphagus sp. NBT04N3]QYH38446.1 DUF1684 domain-containing protein [Algoriphagus sp. NBT04N3]